MKTQNKVDRSIYLTDREYIKLLKISRDNLDKIEKVDTCASLLVYLLKESLIKKEGIS